MSTTAPAPLAGGRARPLWRRLIGFNLLTAVVLGVGGYYLGWFIGHQITGASFDYHADIDENDVALLLGYVFGVDRLPARPRLRSTTRVARMLGPPAVAAREGGAGHGPLLRPVHRPQGRRHPVPVRRSASSSSSPGSTRC